MHKVLHCQYYLLYSVKYAWSYVSPYLCILQVLITWSRLILGLELIIEYLIYVRQLMFDHLIYVRLYTIICMKMTYGGSNFPNLGGRCFTTPPPLHIIYPPKTLTIIISMNLTILMNCLKKIESFIFFKFENPSSGSEVGGVRYFSTPPFYIYPTNA